MYDHFDGLSAAAMAQASWSSRADIAAHPGALRAILNARLELPSTFNATDDNLLDAIRACASTLSREDAQYIVDVALSPSGDPGKAPLLGALIAGGSDEAATALALRLDAFGNTPSSDSPLTAADQNARRARLLVGVLTSIGNARPGVYEPFVERLTSELYDINGTGSASSLSFAFPDMPQLVRDRICAALLDRELPQSTYFNTFQMFRSLRYLSPQMRDKVFLTAKAIKEAKDGRASLSMQKLFDVEANHASDVFKDLDSSVYEKWQALLPTPLNRASG